MHSTSASSTSSQAGTASGVMSLGDLAVRCTASRSQPKRAHWGALGASLRYRGLRSSRIGLTSRLPLIQTIPSRLSRDLQALSTKKSGQAGLRHSSGPSPKEAISPSICG